MTNFKDAINYLDINAATEYIQNKKNIKEDKLDLIIEHVIKVCDKNKISGAKKLYNFTYENMNKLNEKSLEKLKNSLKSKNSICYSALYEINFENPSKERIAYLTSEVANTKNELQILDFSNKATKLTLEDKHIITDSLIDSNSNLLYTYLVNNILSKEDILNINKYFIINGKELELIHSLNKVNKQDLAIIEKDILKTKDLKIIADYIYITKNMDLLIKIFETTDKFKRFCKISKLQFDVDLLDKDFDDFDLNNSFGYAKENVKRLIDKK